MKAHFYLPQLTLTMTTYNCKNGFKKPRAILQARLGWLCRALAASPQASLQLPGPLSGQDFWTSTLGAFLPPDGHTLSSHCQDCLLSLLVIPSAFFYSQEGLS